MSFASLGLAPALVRAADLQGCLAPTAVQAQAIPAVLQGRDLLALAPTGSGKTLAYALPLIQRLQVARRPWPHRTQALVLLPTRELAQQVGEVCAALARALPEPPKVVTAHGGVSINPQLMALRGGAELVVATPGRLLDLLAHRGLRLQALNCIVLDEADRLLEAGFADEWAAIRAALPGGPERRLQHLLFSATLPAEVEALAAATFQAGSGQPPRRVDLREGAEAPPPDISQRTIAVDTGRRSGLLRQLLLQAPPTEGWDRVLVFVASRYATELVAHKLQRHGIAAAALHGELSQGARNAALADFRAGRLRVLVATDLAARGLDIVDLPVVVNFDLPRSTEDYTHRIGRTGRAGAHGLAISFVPAAAEAHMRLIEKRRGERFEREVLPGFEPQEAAPPAVVQDGSGGIKGRRPSKKDKLRAAAAVTK